MIRRTASHRPWRRPALVSGLIAIMGGGCAPRAIEPATIPNQALGPMVIAVAPALNFSGASDFDPNSVADLMAGELSCVEGVNVVPVSRVLAVLARQGRQEIGSPGHALEVVETLGADAILVFAVTDYDPYNPPIVGIAAQLYGSRRDDSVGSLDPILVSRQARPYAIAPRVPATFPLAQSERVFDASRGDIGLEVREYAARHRTDPGPWGWEKYLVSQRHYLRYCCHAIVEELASGGDLSEVAVLSVR